MQASFIVHRQFITSEVCKDFKGQEDILKERNGMTINFQKNLKSNGKSAVKVAKFLYTTRYILQH